MLYHREDTLFDNLLQRANIRLKFGETNILELNAAQLQKASIFEQISALKADSTLLVAQLNILLDDKEKYIPMEMSLRYVSPDKIDSLDIDNLYIIRRLEQEKKSAEMKQKMEIAKLSPDMTIGINNMSIKGTGANDKYYNYGYRFTSGYFAVDIPFFKKSQKQKISSYDMLTQSIDKQKEVEVNAIQQQLEEWKILYYHHQSQMNDIEKNRLSYAKSIENAALQQLINGEINYLEWTLLMQQSLSVQRAYFDHLQAANHYAIKIYYLTHQN
jgi:cobalt-zinc-cadmium resistance protein CzcA